MKRGNSSLYYYYCGLGKNGDGDDGGESSKETIRVSAKAHKLAQRENMSSYSIFCDAMVNTMRVGEKERMMKEVMEEKNKVELIREVEEEMGEGVVQVTSGVEKEDRVVVEEKAAKIVGGVEEEKGDKGGAEEAVVDHGNQVDGLGDGQDMDAGEGVGEMNNGGGEIGVYGGVVGNVLEENNNNMDMLASDIFAECDLPGLRDWNFEWGCCYPFYWESEYGAYYYWDVLVNEAIANQWLENLWKD